MYLLTEGRSPTSANHVYCVKHLLEYRCTRKQYAETLRRLLMYRTMTLHSDECCFSTKLFQFQ